MKVVIKNNKLFASHSDDQDLSGLYIGLDILCVNDSINLFQEDGNFITKSELLTKIGISEVECKRVCKWDEVKMKRNSLQTENINFLSHDWQMDDSSILSLMSALRTLTDEIDTLSWRTIDNVMVELTKVQLDDLISLYDNRRLSIFNASMNIKNDIDNASTPNDVELLDIDTLFTAYII